MQIAHGSGQHHRVTGRLKVAEDQLLHGPVDLGPRLAEVYEPGELLVQNGELHGDEDVYWDALNPSARRVNSAADYFFTLVLSSKFLMIVIAQCLCLKSQNLCWKRSVPPAVAGGK